MLSVRIRREASGSCCGNPAGRSKGARSKLGEAFLDALLADFTERGVEAINRVREHDPGAYLRIIASLIPREVVGADAAPLFENVAVTFVNANATKSGLPLINAS